MTITNSPAAIVGLVFLCTGAIKTLSPGAFYAHIAQFGWIPKRFLKFAVELSAAAEAALGVAIIVGLYPYVVLPLGISVLVGLTGFTVISVRSGRVSDCGCYGGYVVPSLGQAVLINFALIALMVLSLVLRPESLMGPRTSIVIVLLAALLFGGFALAGFRHAAKHGRFLISLSPLTIGHVWRKRWSAGIEPTGTDELIVAYLGPECPWCKLWVPILNGIHENPGLPPVIGIVGGTRETLEAFNARTGLRFPSHLIAKSLMSRLVTAVPTTVLIKDGKIQDLWHGQLSPQFVGRFKAAFFPSLRSSEVRSSVSFPKHHILSTEHGP